MAIDTVYTCDISGYSSKKADEFHKVTLKYQPINSASWQDVSLMVCLHAPVAERLGLARGTAKLPAPPSIEHVLTELIQSIATDAVHDALNDR